MAHVLLGHSGVRAPAFLRGLPLLLRGVLAVAASAGCSSSDSPPTYDPGTSDGGAGIATALPTNSRGITGSACPFTAPPGSRVACGTLTVPENPTGASSRMIQLAIAVYESKSASPAPDPVVYLAGGPGGGALDEVACRDRIVGLGIDLAQYNTSANASDIRTLRTALGYASWNVLGVSYGTRLALEVMRQSTDGLRTVVIDSTLPPDVDLLAKDAANTARSLTRVFDTCSAQPECNQVYANLSARLDAVVDKLDVSPLSIVVSGTAVQFAGSDLLGLVRLLLYSPQTIPYFPALLSQLEQNSTTLVSLLLGAIAKAESSIAIAMHLSVACREWAPRTSASAFADASAGVNPRLVRAFDPTKSYLTSCPVWSVPPAPIAEAAAVAVDTPTLVLSGDYDPITPPEWGQHVASTLAHGQFVLFAGGAHAVKDLACAGKLIGAFLDAGAPIAEPSCPEHDAPISVIPNIGCIMSPPPCPKAQPFSVHSGSQSSGVDLDAFELRARTRGRLR